MTKDYWEIIEERLKRFSKMGDEIKCISLFKKPESNCELCGHHPISWFHVLLNERTGEILKVGSVCMIHARKVLQKGGSEDKTKYFEKFRKVAERFKSVRQGTAEIILFPATELMKQISTKPEKFGYERITSILKYAAKSHQDEYLALFDRALDIWISRNYYRYEKIENKKADSEEEIRKKIREDIETEAREELYELSYLMEEPLLGFFDESSFDDLAPERIGSDEIDWDSYRYE